MSRPGDTLIARRLLLLLVAAAALVPVLGHAQVGRHRIRLRMDGYVGAPPEGRREEADLTLRVGETYHRFQVTHAVVLSGQALAADVFDRRRPYKPSFFLRGPKELLDPLGHATPGTRLRIIGVWIPGSSDFLVASIEPPPHE